jgi:hypothetical protein
MEMEDLDLSRFISPNSIQKTGKSGHFGDLFVGNHSEVGIVALKKPRVLPRASDLEAVLKVKLCCNYRQIPNSFFRGSRERESYGKG